MSDEPGLPPPLLVATNKAQESCTSQAHPAPAKVLSTRPHAHSQQKALFFMPWVSCDGSQREVFGGLASTDKVASG